MVNAEDIVKKILGKNGKEEAEEKVEKILGEDEDD